MGELCDMHVHLAWFEDARAVAEALAARGVFACAVTVTPDECVHTRALLAGCGNVEVGVGAHPWWVADGRLSASDVESAARLACDAPLVGEMGLDFSRSHVPAGSEGAQVAALRALLRACDAGARLAGPKLLSLHAVRSAGTVLDLLEQSGCLASCRCVFHWFSGTGDELHRAVRAGCWFSVGEMMLRTRRGREYARQLPEGRLLLETDLPPSERSACTADAIVSSLDASLAALRAIRAPDIGERIAANARLLLGRG